MALSGSNIAAGWTEPISEDERFIGMATLPIDHPAEVEVTVLDPGFSCNMEGLNVVQPLAAGDGFVAVTQGAQECDALLSWWSSGCDLVDGPHDFFGLTGDAPGTQPFAAAVAEAPVDEQQRLVAASLTTAEGAGEPGDESLLFAIDRFGPDGTHERLLDETFDWSAEFAKTGSMTHFVVNGATSESGGAVTVVANSPGGAIVLARGTLDGEVTDPPAVIFDPKELQASAPQDWETCSAEIAWAGDRVLGVIQMGCYGESPFLDFEFFSVVFTADGQIVDGPHDLDELETGNEPVSSGIGLDWSGEVYGHCYHDGSEGFWFVALDSGGLPASEPLLLVSYNWPNGNPFCDVVAVDSDTFAVLVSLNGAADDLQPGLYLVFVELSEVE